MASEQTIYCGLSNRACIPTRCRLWDREASYKGSSNGCCSVVKLARDLGEIRQILSELAESKVKS